jgi:hypothetical protein
LVFGAVAAVGSAGLAYSDCQRGINASCALDVGSAVSFGMSAGLGAAARAAAADAEAETAALRAQRSTMPRGAYGQAIRAAKAQAARVAAWSGSATAADRALSYTGIGAAAISATRYVGSKWRSWADA